MPRLFISYSRVDRPFVDDFVPLVRDVWGYDNVWFDDNLHGGQIWWEEITSQIAACDIFVYLLSNDSVTSEYCQAEYQEAQRLQKQILPVQIRARTNIPEDLRRIHFVDMSAGIKPQGLNKFHAGVSRLSTRLTSTLPEPLDSQPVPKPSVSDVKPRRKLGAREGILAFVVALIVIAVSFVLLSQANGGSQNGTTTPTDAVAFAPTDEPSTTTEPTDTSEPPSPTYTPSITATDTATDVPPTATNTPMPPTDTSAPTEMPTIQPTDTFTLTPSYTATVTPLPTATPTKTPVPPTDTPTVTAGITSVSGFIPITAANASDLELGYALPGECGIFSPDGTLLTTDTGVYDVASGTRRFAIDGYGVFSPDGTLLMVGFDGVYDVASGTRRFAIDGFGTFSPDGTLLAVSGDGVYEVATGTHRFDIEAAGVFSPDGTLLAVDGDDVEVYDVASGTRRFAIDGLAPRFSPDGTLLAVSLSGVYDVASGNRRFDIEAAGVFSPDGTLLAVGGDGVYDVVSGNRRFDIEAAGVFSPDGTLLAVGGDGVYDVVSGNRRFVVQSYSVEFSPDGLLLAVGGDAVYEVATGARRFNVEDYSPMTFSPDGTLLAQSQSGSASQGQFNIQYWEVCTLYGDGNNSWAYRVGTITADNRVNIRTSPSGPFVVGVLEGNAFVLARTPDNDWFRIEEDKWVSASAVRIINMPENVPIENS